MASQLEMVNTLLSDAEAVCTGRAQMTKEYNPEPGDSWETTLAGRVHHKRPSWRRCCTTTKQSRSPTCCARTEMGRTDPVPDARLHSMAVDLRDKMLVDKFLAERTPIGSAPTVTLVCVRVCMGFVYKVSNSHNMQVLMTVQHATASRQAR